MEAAIKRVEGVATTGVFGPGVVVGVKANSEDGKGAQFASQLFFLKVVLKTDVITEVPVVVKMHFKDPEREFMSSDDQFANEVNMHEKILPKLNGADLGIFCKMFYGLATYGENPSQDVVVFEDLRPLGYKVLKTVFVDFEHFSLGMRKLGEFHGLSYKLKKQSPQIANDLAKLLIPPRVLTDGGAFFERALHRGFKPLLDKHPDGIASKAFKKLTSIPKQEIMKKMKIPEEPFAVVIHGDFNVNNLLFRYKDDKLTDMKFIDFATSMYSDPAIDIFFFLYLNTSPEMRDEHWDEFLRTYWEGLVSIEENPGFEFEEFSAHIEKRAVWGYLLCSFFLPFMLSPESQELQEDFRNSSEEEQRTEGMEVGGEKGTEAVSCIARHLLDKGFLKKFVDEFDLEA